MDTLILRDDLFLRHQPGPGHPENPARLQAVHDDLDRDPIAGTRTVPPRAATRAELTRIHRPEHVDRVAATAAPTQLWDTANCPPRVWKWRPNRQSRSI